MGIVIDEEKLEGKREKTKERREKVRKGERILDFNKKQCAVHI